MSSPNIAKPFSITCAQLLSEILPYFPKIGYQTVGGHTIWETGQQLGMLIVAWKNGATKESVKAHPIDEI